MSETIRERIEAGAAWLDEVKPDWRDSINLSTLQLNSRHDCVLGQVFYAEAQAYYTNGFCYALNTFPEGEEFYQQEVWAVARGFETARESYDILQAAWERYLTEED